MKTARNIYNKIYEFENIYLAYRKAKRGKSLKKEVAAFDYDLEQNLITIQEELRNETYEPGKYRNFHIYRPKHRYISAEPFRDRVVHHALINIIEPIFEPMFDYDSYACRKNKGTHKAVGRAQMFLRKYKYYLKMDVLRFFPSVDHEILMSILKRKIRDRKIIRLVKRILSSGEGILNNEYIHVFYPGDDLFSVSRPRGLPIGNLTSQFFANVYLDKLDKFIRAQIKPGGYVRYSDDFILFDDSFLRLKDSILLIGDFLMRLRLSLHPDKLVLAPSHSGICFLGFHIYRGYKKLLNENVVRMRRRLKDFAELYGAGNVSLEKIRASLMSWIGYAKFGNTYGLRKAIFKDFVLKRV